MTLYRADGGLNQYGGLHRASGVSGELFAALFSGSNHLSSDSANFEFGDTDFSLICWFYPTSAQNGVLMGKAVSIPDFGYQMRVHTNGTGLRVLISNDGTTVVEVNTGGAVSLNTWHLGVFVHDSVNNKIKVSLDGAAFIEDTHSGGAFTSSEDFALGKNGTSYIGRIDSPLTYTKTLSIAQIGTIYNSGAGIPITTLDQVSLQNYWKANELSGPRIDFIGSDNLTDNSSVGRAIGKILD